MLTVTRAFLHVLDFWRFDFAGRDKHWLSYNKSDNEHTDSCNAVCFTPLGVCGKQILLNQIYLSSAVNIKPMIMKMSDGFFNISRRQEEIKTRDYRKMHECVYFIYILAWRVKWVGVGCSLTSLDIFFYFSEEEVLWILVNT